jgi:hypothetical protein
MGAKSFLDVAHRTVVAGLGISAVACTGCAERSEAPALRVLQRRAQRAASPRRARPRRLSRSARGCRPASLLHCARAAPLSDALTRSEATVLRPCLSPRRWLAANMYKGFNFHFSRSREEPTKSS